MDEHCKHRRRWNECDDCDREQLMMVEALSIGAPPERDNEPVRPHVPAGGALRERLFDILSDDEWWEEAHLEDGPRACLRAELEEIDAQQREQQPAGGALDLDELERQALAGIEHGPGYPLEAIVDLIRELREAQASIDAWRNEVEQLTAALHECERRRRQLRAESA